MLMPHVMQVLRTSSTLRRYHTTLNNQIRQDPLFQHMPTLFNLPMFTNDGEQLTPLYLFNYASPYLALYGDASSGGSLLLLQLALYATMHSHTDPVLYLPLATIDMPEHPPRFILEHIVRKTGLPNPFMKRIGSNIHNWVVLVDQWHELPPARRSGWRNFLQSLPFSWQDARVIVTLPPTEEEWNRYDSMVLAAPTATHVTQWLHHLLPEPHSTALCHALLPTALAQPSREPLFQSVFDVVVFALGYNPTPAALPTTRTALYQQGLEHCVAIQAKQKKTNGSSMLWKNTLTNYQLAVRLATAGPIATLATLDGEQRSDVAIILASLLPDPTPLYTMLWANGHPTLDNSLILGWCLLKYPQKAPSWIVPILEALAAKKSIMPHRHILQSLGAILPLLFETIGDDLPEERASVLLKDIATLLSDPTILAILDTPTFPDSLRWTAADILQQQEQQSIQLFTQRQPPDMLAQAARCSLLALGTTTSRRLLATPEAAGWIVAMRDATVSQQRRLQVASALLNDHAIPAVLRATALMLISQFHDDTTLTILKRICADQDARVRNAALTALRNREPRQALWVLHEVMLIDYTTWEARQDALKTLVYYPQKEASVLLARCALSKIMPLAGRIHALAMLKDRGKHGAVLLRRIVRVKTAHPAVRAVAALLLGKLADKEATAELLQLAIFNNISLIRQQAIHALVAIAQHNPADHEYSNEVVTMLLAALNSPHYDTELTICIVQALGKLPGTRIPLQQLLASESDSQLEHHWLQCIPPLARVPIYQWHELAIPDEYRVVLLSALTEGTTDIEQPGSLDELTKQAANRVRVAIARALVAIWEREDSDQPTKQAISQTLLDAIYRSTSYQETRLLLAELVHISDTAGLNEIELFLSDTTRDYADSTLPWLAIEQLGTQSTAVPLLLHYLAQETLDPCTRGMIAAVPGLHTHSHALPLLCRLATRQDVHEHLRFQAIQTLHHAQDQALVRDSLFALVHDEHVSPMLRSAAAKALPPDLLPTQLHSLRELLRRPTTPPELGEGIIMALGKARDYEAMTLILHYAESTHTDVALAALVALANIGDDRVAPTLLRIAQSPHRDQSICLQAVITLLRLCGEEYLPFLRSFLDSPLLPLQLQALDELLSAWIRYAQPLILVANKHAPLALRLRALEEVARRKDYHSVLSELLLDKQEPHQLRSLIANLLGHTGGRDAVDALSSCVCEAETTPTLQRRCIQALAAQAQSSHACADDAYLVVGFLAEEPSLSQECRAWATHALVTLASMRFDAHEEQENTNE